MRRDQAQSRAAVGERQHREVPTGSVLGIKRSVGLLGQPGVELLARPRCRDDLQLGLVDGSHPAVPAER